MSVSNAKNVKRTRSSWELSDSEDYMTLSLKENSKETRKQPELQSHLNYFAREVKVSHLSNFNCLKFFFLHDFHSLPWLRNFFFSSNSFLEFLPSICTHTFYATYRKLFLWLKNLNLRNVCTIDFFFCEVNLLNFKQFMVRKVKEHKLCCDWCCLMDSVWINFPQKCATLHQATLWITNSACQL